MKRLLALPVLLILSACGQVGQPSDGLYVTYDQSTSRAAYDHVAAEAHR